MEILDGMRIEEIICVRLDYGDDFLQCIEDVARAKDIQTGVIVSGIGTFDRARIHYITHTSFPGEDKIVELAGPIELASVQGIIADYTPHLHCSMAVRGDEPFIGHLEPGCTTLYLCEVVIARLSGRPLTRMKRTPPGTMQLTAKGRSEAA